MRAQVLNDEARAGLPEGEPGGLDALRKRRAVSTLLYQLGSSRSVRALERTARRGARGATMEDMFAPYASSNLVDFTPR